jgi:dTDP-4-dehydrorhamnose reductase
MKILITGGSGLLGQYLNIELSKNHSILTLYNKDIRNCANFNSAKLDITNRNILEELFNSFNPQVVIHTAAISNPQLAASIDSKMVYKTNVKATQYIAELCSQKSARLIYTSTDLVYAGYRGSILKEDSKLNPVSLYAETKLMGEMKIKETFNDYLILRTALMFGFGLNNSYNHFHQMYMNLKNHIPVKLFTDQFRTPVELRNASKIITQLIQKKINEEIINLGGKERISRFQLGEILCETAGFDKNLLLKISMDDIPALPKVEDVSMDTSKLKSFGIEIKSVKESIRDLINEN